MEPELSDFCFRAGPGLGARAAGATRLRHGAACLSLAVGPAGHLVRVRWPGGRWEEAAGLSSMPPGGLARSFQPGRPFWHLEARGPLRYRATGRQEAAPAELLAAMWQEATGTAAGCLAFQERDRGVALRYWLPPQVLVVRVLYVFADRGCWILTQSAWEWR